LGEASEEDAAGAEEGNGDDGFACEVRFVKDEEGKEDEGEEDGLPLDDRGGEAEEEEDD
jgi:hypothetical protein